MQPHPIISGWELFEQNNSLQSRLGNEENEKENIHISMENNSNCWITHEHNTAMFFMSQLEISRTQVSKSEGTFKQKIGDRFKVSA